MRHRPALSLARPALCAVALAALAGCTEPGFLRQAEPAPTPALLPIEELLTGDSARLDAEAAAALSARGAALRTRAQATP
ncbi:hypothetical protein GU920_02470 [Rhodobacter sp. CCP-1]|uniref:Uncharacterized protein n=2 Tax=Paragemmobacter ruber TaxID=1985673 RepID=A0ABW9Y1L4_9RHOB|nr:hypothetical protein [Rhodobacter ruber]